MQTPVSLLQFAPRDLDHVTLRRTKLAFERKLGKWRIVQRSSQKLNREI